MNPLFSEFKRKFSVSMYKNMQIPLGEMNFLKDFVNDTRGDLYPVFEKSADCKERVGENRFYVEGGSTERVFCQFFPFATYELIADKVDGEVGFAFRIPGASAIVTVKRDTNATSLTYKCGEHTESFDLPRDFAENSPWLVTCRPGFFDIYYRVNGGAIYYLTIDEPEFAESNRYATFKDGNVSLIASGKITVSKVTSALDNGVSIADFRAVKYEDGTPIHENGKVYFTASIRTHAGNYQSIFSWVPGTMQFEMTGILFFDHGDGFWRGYIASSILYHREKKEWYVWVSSFEHDHILAYGSFKGDPRFGIGVADVKIMDRATEDNKMTDFIGFFRDEDPDLIYDEETNRWLLAICRIDPEIKKYRYVFFESDDPFKNFRCIGCGVQEESSETGGSFLRVNGELHFVCGNTFDRRSEYRIYSKDGMKLAKFRYPDGGFRGWGCVMPLTLGARTRYFWLTFDRHNGSSYNWSYGNVYCFEAEEYN
ncbi:MAG: hypothetical protein IJD79_02380 [Clostridia bacterium]|nr:hypothetical protein [Clostridia bacterium]